MLWTEVQSVNGFSPGEKASLHYAGNRTSTQKNRRRPNPRGRSPHLEARPQTKLRVPGDLRCMNAAHTSPLRIKNIVYATDFSPCSENAGHYANLLARDFNAALLVAHAFVLSYPAMEVEAEDGLIKKSEQRKDLEAALAATTRRFGKGIKKAAPVLLDGDPREQVPRLAEENAPSLIVLGTQGRARMDRGIIGSVADRIIRVTNGPSLTVGPEVPPCDPRRPLFQQVLYATVLSPEAAHGAVYAAAVTETFGSSLEVLHVVNPEDVADKDRFSEIQKRFRVVLNEIAPKHAEKICRPEGLVEIGSAHKRILQYLEESHVDLLVLAIHKSSHLWLQSRLSGAFHIIANAPCPVLTITG
jgi:nucleotide-binding universal stress UspA family protein